MTVSKKLRDFAENAYKSRVSFLRSTTCDPRETLSKCNENEAILLKYLLGTLPLTDLGDYSPEFFLSFVRHGIKLRESVAHCSALPEHIFLKEVLYPRINNEELSDCRELFYNAIYSRIEGLSSEEAALEVNKWCAEEVTYRSTDDRTASALAVFECCYGRCGEESTFAVNALRSVGIPARQVYAPRWSHCDDNHAWVEIYINGKWRYLGACEPEPELDRGWFTGAAARAMLVHARCFVGESTLPPDFLFPEARKIDLDTREGVVYETVTANYADVREVSVLVRDENREPLPEIEVELSVLNMAEFFAIARRNTDENGKARLNLGLGSIWISTEHDGKRAEGLFDISESGNIELVLKRSEDTVKEINFTPPVDLLKYPTPLTEAQKRERAEVLAHADKLRENKIKSEKKQLSSERQKRIARTLSEKDRASSVKEEIFTDAEAAFTFEGEYPTEIFENYLLSQRIGLEPLSPWRRLLFEAFSNEEKTAFRADPERIWLWIEKNIRSIASYNELPQTPAGAFGLKAATASGKAVLFCAICRGIGVPARLSPQDNLPQYYVNREFVLVSKAGRGAALRLKSPQNPSIFRQNYSLSRKEGSHWETIITENIPKNGELEISLFSGEYRLITTVRLPNGSQLARIEDFSLADGEIAEKELKFREGSISEMLSDLTLPHFTLKDLEGRGENSEEILKTAPLSLFCKLEVGREPTEHILNELRASAESFKKLEKSLQIHFVLRDAGDTEDKNLSSTLQKIPGAKLWQGDFEDAEPSIPRRLYVDGERLPLIFLASRKGKALYANSGYNVGTAELLLGLISEILK